MNDVPGVEKGGRFSTTLFPRAYGDFGLCRPLPGVLMRAFFSRHQQKHWQQDEVGGSTAVQRRYQPDGVAANAVDPKSRRYGYYYRYRYDDLRGENED